MQLVPVAVRLAVRERVGGVLDGPDRFRVDFVVDVVVVLVVREQLEPRVVHDQQGLRRRERHVARRRPRQVDLGEQMLRCRPVGAAILRRLVRQCRFRREKIRDDRVVHLRRCFARRGREHAGGGGEVERDVAEGANEGEIVSARTNFASPVRRFLVRPERRPSPPPR